MVIESIKVKNSYLGRCLTPEPACAHGLYQGSKVCLSYWITLYLKTELI